MSKIPFRAALFDLDGTLLDSFRVRAVKALKGLGGMFFKKSEYKDEEDNLLK